MPSFCRFSSVSIFYDKYLKIRFGTFDSNAVQIEISVYQKLEKLVDDKCEEKNFKNFES